MNGWELFAHVVPALVAVVLVELVAAWLMRTGHESTTDD